MKTKIYILVLAGGHNGRVMSCQSLTAQPGLPRRAHSGGQRRVSIPGVAHWQDSPVLSSSDRYFPIWQKHMRHR